MKEYSIFVDSSADLDPQFVTEHDIRMVTMRYTLGSETGMVLWSEDETEKKKFYDELRSGNMPHTSQVSPQQYIDAFTPVLRSGRDILYISLSGGLTNFHDSISIAKLDLAEQFPDAAVYEVDSLAASGGIGLLAELAEENRQNGMPVEENVRCLNEAVQRVCHLFMVEDLMFLKRGGRIPAATAVIGTVLNISPILIIDEAGKLQVTEKIRGKKHALTYLLSQYRRYHDTENKRVFVIHADAPELAAQLAEKIQDSEPDARVTVRMLSPIIGAHTGPGLAAVIWFANRADIG